MPVETKAMVAEETRCMGKKQDLEGSLLGDF